ncbi:MAG: glycosyltransferase family 39 protein [Planctomycetota bacterium]
MDRSYDPPALERLGGNMDGLTRRATHGWNRGLLLTLLVAFAVRLGLAFAVEQRVAAAPGSVCLIPGDADGYWELARKIVAGQDYSIYAPPRHVLRMPGFPILLALSQRLFGESTLAARLLLVCVGTGACGLTYWLGRELCDPMTGLLAAIYTALSPTMALFSVLLLSETAFAATLLASLIAIVRMARRAEGVSSARCLGGVSLLAGVLIGVATYMRPTWLYAGPMIAVVVLWSRRGERSAKSILMAFCWLVVGLAVTLSPWVWRNYSVTGHFAPTTLWVGPSLYDGLHPGATGDSDMNFFEQDQLLTTMSEYEMDREYRRRAMAFAWENPVRAMWLAVLKQGRYWSLVPNAAQFRDAKLQVAVLLAVLPLFVFALCGAWLARRDVSLLALTAGAIVLFAGMHLFFVGSLRYRLPAEYPFAVLAAWGVRPLLIRCGCLPGLASS